MAGVVVAAKGVDVVVVVKVAPKVVVENGLVDAAGVVDIGVEEVVVGADPNDTDLDAGLWLSQAAHLLAPGELRSMHTSQLHSPCLAANMLDKLGRPDCALAVDEDAIELTTTVAAAVVAAAGLGSLQQGQLF